MPRATAETSRACRDATRSPPIAKHLTEAGTLDDAAFAEMGKAAAKQVEDAIDFAKSSPLPDPAEALRYVFAEGATK